MTRRSFTPRAARGARSRWRLASAVLAPLGVALALAACGSSTAPLPRASAPDELRFTIGGFGLDASTVEVRGDTVLLVRMAWNPQPGEGPDTTRVVPTADEWRAFWMAAEEAGVRAWQKEYAADGVVDGLGWTLRIAHDGRVVQSSGNNAYPDRLGREQELEMTDDFRAFLAGLGELAGRTLP